MNIENDFLHFVGSSTDKKLEDILFLLKMERITIPMAKEAIFSLFHVSETVNGELIKLKESIARDELINEKTSKDSNAIKWVQRTQDLYKDFSSR